MFASSVAAGLIPEALPVIINANLARGGYVLFRKGAIVQRPDSVQNLGAMSILCGDKVRARNFEHEMMLIRYRLGP
jgi:Mg2+-importing ATPase